VVPKSKASEGSHASRQRPYTYSDKTGSKSSQRPTLTRPIALEGLIRVRDANVKPRGVPPGVGGWNAFAAGRGRRNQGCRFFPREKFKLSF
jgi:hypothetical protein